MLISPVRSDRSRWTHLYPLDVALVSPPDPEIVTQRSFSQAALTITVLQLPPRESRSTDVIMEFRYGTWARPCTNTELGGFVETRIWIDDMCASLCGALVQGSPTRGGLAQAPHMYFAG